VTTRVTPWLVTARRAVIRRAVIRRAVIRRAVIRHGVIRHGVIRHGVIRHGVIRHGVIRRAAIRRGALVLGVSLLGAPVASRAQTVTLMNSLSFGTIWTGSTTSVAYTAPGAAQWKVSSTLKLLNQVTFTLPTTLTRSDGKTMSVTYCTTCAAYNTSNSTSGATTFNPNASYTIGLIALSPIYIWLGASVSPPLNQPAGTYTGSVVLTVAGLGL
jgi:hypothetical protein